MQYVDKRINVAHLIASLRFGGAENQVSLLLSHLDPSRYQPHLITFGECAGGFREMLPEHVRFHSINYRRRNAPISLFRLYRVLKDQRIDVLHCHMYHAGVKGAVAGYLASVPVTIVSEHGKNTWKTWFHHLVERQIVSRLTACRIAVSEDIRQIRIQEDGVPPASVKIIQNSVDTNVSIADNTIVPSKLGALGRLVEAKDYPVLLQAVKILKDRGMKLSLRIAGEGDERSRLERKIVELGLGDCVELAGNQDARKFLSETDLFVMSSKREGVPVAMLEAMAHGLPIVATAVGGIPEVLEDGNEGLLCESGDPKCLAEQIVRVVEDKTLRTEMGRSARQKVVQQYGIQTIVGQWEALYESLLQEKRGIK